MVICRHCKYNKKKAYDEDECKLNAEKGDRHPITGKRTPFYNSCSAFNDDGKCPNYKEKLYWAILRLFFGVNYEG